MADDRNMPPKQDVSWMRGPLRAWNRLTDPDRWALALIGLYILWMAFLAWVNLS